MVPPSETDLVEAWFSLSFGLQQVYAFREPVGADFQPSARDGLVVRRAVAADIPALAELDMVLPNHTHGSPVFSTLKLPSIEESAAELVDDINNPKYNFWVRRARRARHFHARRCIDRGVHVVDADDAAR